MNAQAEPVTVRCVDALVNDEVVACEVPVRQHLADFLRERLGLTGTHVGCEHGVCGACTVRLDGVPVRACLMLAVQIDGCRVQTIEGLDDDPAMGRLQRAFAERNAAQCGFCTPAMLLAALDLMERPAPPSRAEIREHLSGNACRCTGYQAIVDAVQDACRQHDQEQG